MPDDWNSGTASGTYSNLNWGFHSVAAVNNEASAFFIVTTTPPLSGFLVSLGEAIGITSSLISNNFTLKDEYDVRFKDGSRGRAYSINASSDQLSRAQSILPVDKDIDAILISTKQHGAIYVILYFTEMGRMVNFSQFFREYYH